MSSYLEELNDAQRAAVEYTDGPQLVIAGAGSGKTRVLTYKTVHLLSNGYHPSSILALTFTNKAAREMRERISALLGDEIASQIWMGTFHSIFSRILRYNAELLGFKNNFTIYDAADSKSLIRTIIRDLKLDDKIYRPGAVMADISNAKNNLYSPEDYARDAELLASDRVAKRERTVEIYKIYRDRCRVAGAMDFDDLLFYTNVLLRDHPEVAERYKQRFKYILVDEYQDTNFAQHMIVRQLCNNPAHLCVVGDDAQSIYSFRGANIRNILDLKKSFPTLQTYKLEENYRSTRNILGAANTLIAANREQIKKEVFTRGGEGELIEVCESYNDYEEAYALAMRIAQIRRNMGLSLNDVAVLYRTNAQSRVIEDALRNRNIPHQVYGGLAFYQRKEIKDAIAYFRLSVNPNDDEALTRVINTPKRGIGDTTVAKVRACAVEANVSMFEVLSNPDSFGLAVNKGTKAKLSGFASLVGQFVKGVNEALPADKLASLIIGETGLLQEFISENTPECISKRDNLIELLNGVADYTRRTTETSGPENATMGNYLAEISLLTDQDEDDAPVDKVKLMTIHAAKGLEFGAVFIVGVEENLLPSEKSLRNAADVEEERRLMYVAITRAKRYCRISYARNRMINGRPTNSAPSRFIMDIAPKYLRPMTGTRLPKAKAPEAPKASYFEQRQPTSRPREEVKVVTNSQSPQSFTTPADNGQFSIHTPQEIKEGMKIEHPTFGYGTVEVVNTTMSDARFSVRFYDDSLRTLLFKYARFRILS